MKQYKREAIQNQGSEQNRPKTDEEHPNVLVNGFAVVAVFHKAFVVGIVGSVQLNFGDLVPKKNCEKCVPQFVHRNAQPSEQNHERFAPQHLEARGTAVKRHKVHGYR